LFQLSPINLKT